MGDHITIQSFMTDTILESTKIPQTAESSSLTASEPSLKHESDIGSYVSMSSDAETIDTMVTQIAAVKNLTKTLQQTTTDSTLLYSSYGGDVSESSLFLMQHATQGLPPGNTDFAFSMDSSQFSMASWSNPSLILESQTSSSSIILNHQNFSSVLNTFTIHAMDISPISASGFKEQFSSGYLSYSDSLMAISTSSLHRNLEQNSSVTKLHAAESSTNYRFDSVKQISDYITSDSMLYLPTISSTSLDNVSSTNSEHIFQTGTVPSVKPVRTLTNSILEGNFYLYIGVPLCGLAVLVFLILCIICIKRCKTKSKGSPAKNHIPDLWVQSCGEVPLTITNSVQEANGGESIMVQRDLGCTTYEAVFDFCDDQYNHLYLKAGDQVKVHKKAANGFWQGTVHDQVGWFPNNCVQAVSYDQVVTENERAMRDDSPISSFMIKRSDTPTNRQSFLTEEEIKAEPIYCKIQPKEKRKSPTKDSNHSSSSSPTKSETSVEDVRQQISPIPPDGLTKFVALYPYTATCTGQLSINEGDIIMCTAEDVKGWTHGHNQTTQMEGWAPSSYIEKVPWNKSPSPDIDLKCYNDLEVNTGTDNTQDFVGIIHRAIHTFNGEKAGDLPFNQGDLVTVFQVLENGWWLGCKDTVVGWFPGCYVEIVKQPSTNSTPSPGSIYSITQSPSESPVPAEDTQMTTAPAEDPQDTNVSSETSFQSVQNPQSKSKLKPSRKAPNPPSKTTSNVESKIPTPSNRTPKVARPKVPPPLPPDASVKLPHDNMPQKSIQQNGDENIKQAEIVKKQDTSNNGKDEVIQHTGNTENDLLPMKGKTKPPVPKRYIKPKLISIPRHEIKMPGTESSNSDLIKNRSPPPTKRMIPKLGPIRVKLKAPQSFEDKNPSEDETVFQVTPQRKFDAFVRQESEPEVPISQYKDLSSFRSTFGNHQDQKEIIVKDTIVDYDIPAKDAGIDCKNLGQKTTYIQRENEENIKAKEMKSTTNTPHDISVDLDKTVSNISVSSRAKSSKLPPPKHVTTKLSAASIKPADQIPLEAAVLAADLSPEKSSKLPRSCTDTSLKNPSQADDAHTRTEESILLCPFKSAAAPKQEFTDKANSANVNEIVGELPKSVENDNVAVNDLQARVDSIGKPFFAPKPKSGLPKLQLKAKASVQTKKDNAGSPVVDIIVSDKIFQPDAHSPIVASSLAPDNNVSTDESDAKPDNEQSVVSTTSLGNAITQSPHLRGRKSQIPGSRMRNKSTDKLDSSGMSHKLSESDSDVPMSPKENLKEKTESSKLAKKQTSKQINTTLRHRSNSPSNRTGIPLSVRTQSNSPGTVLAGAVSTVQTESPVSSGINSPAQKATTSNKRSGLILPKKILNGVEVSSTSAIVQSSYPAFSSNKDLLEQNLDSLAMETLNPKLDQLSNSLKVQKQKGKEGKPPKHGKSLLPVIYKDAGAGSLDGTDLSNTGTKLKSAIPVVKQARQQQSKTVSSSSDNSSEVKTALLQAVKGYSAQCDGELSFSEGTFVQELSDCDRPGWCVGMLADGTTGLYPTNHFRPSLISGHSEA